MWVDKKNIFLDFNFFFIRKGESRGGGADGEQVRVVFFLQ